MKKITDFIKSKTYAIVWTACYVTLMWAILYGLFDFPMFSAAAWDRVLHAHLRGFAGFTFGILVLAAVPLYVATTTIIVRTGKPLFTVKIPECIRKMYAPPPPPAKEAEPDPAPATKPHTDTYEMPSHLPTELHGAFLRARSHTLSAPSTAFSTPQLAQTPVLTPATPATTTTAASATTTIAPSGTLPLPTDFDFDTDADSTTDDTPFTFNDIPMFSDITFGDDTPIDGNATSDATATTTDTPDTPTTQSADGAPPPANPVVEFFATHNRPAEMRNNLIFCDDMVIAIHDNPDFWIADDETWFANGTQRPSPIAELRAAATDALRPVLYLATRNILDIDTKIAQWQSTGITIVTDLNTLL